VADLSAIASLATASGTLVLAIATFGSVRSANRAARVAERALLAGLRPVLATARPTDVEQKINWGDEHYTRLKGGQAGVEVADGVIYLSIPLRNPANGIAVLHGWYVHPTWDATIGHADPEDFRRQQRDLYVASGDAGFWQGALRDPAEPLFSAMVEAIDEPRRFMIDVLYSDHEGGQRTITRWGVTPTSDPAVWLCTVARHWNVDRPDPR
jgi:hypothetical protein